jgi:hypothetical protein
MRLRGPAQRVSQSAGEQSRERRQADEHGEHAQQSPQKEAQHLGFLSDNTRPAGRLIGSVAPPPGVRYPPARYSRRKARFYPQFASSRGPLRLRRARIGRSVGAGLLAEGYGEIH